MKRMDMDGDKATNREEISLIQPNYILKKI